MITDFGHGLEVINLQAIDVNSEVLGNKQFLFARSAAFGDVASELRSGAGVLSFDFTGDGVTDGQPSLTGRPLATVSDILL